MAAALWVLPHAHGGLVGISKGAGTDRPRSYIADGALVVKAHTIPASFFGIVRRIVGLGSA